jgi:hypothetical protein
MKTLFLALIATLAIAGAARAQEPPKAHEHGEQAMPATPPMPMPMPMPMMQMKASMDTQNKKLDDLVAQLNAAKGNDRTDTLVALVNELVAERKAMSAMCGEHMNGMMKTHQ